LPETITSLFALDIPQVFRAAALISYPASGQYTNRSKKFFADTFKKREEEIERPCLGVVKQ